MPTDQLQYFARDVLSLTLTRDGGSIEAIVLINAVLVTFNKIFAADFFTVSVPPNMDLFCEKSTALECADSQTRAIARALDKVDLSGVD